MTLAEHFVKAMSSVNAFTLREIFVSLGTTDGGPRLIIGFADGSQACNVWVNIDGDIHDTTLTRDTPGSPWMQ